MSKYWIYGKEYISDNGTWKDTVSSVIDKLSHNGTRINDECMKASILVENVNDYMHDVVGIYNHSIVAEISRQIAVKYPAYAQKYGYTFE